jgi:hypothetical protein
VSSTSLGDPTSLVADFGRLSLAQSWEHVGLCFNH